MLAWMRSATIPRCEFVCVCNMQFRVFCVVMSQDVSLCELFAEL